MTRSVRRSIRAFLLVVILFLWVPLCLGPTLVKGVVDRSTNLMVRLGLVSFLLCRCLVTCVTRNLTTLPGSLA